MELAAANESVMKRDKAAAVANITKHTVALSDVDDHNEDYYLLEMKARLMAFVWDRIQEQRLTQTQAANKLNVSQGRISNLKNIKHEKFSIDMLISMSFRLGYGFELRSVDAK